MKINDLTLTELASALCAERKRQGLSRENAAAVCGVSTSFIRDAESNPENCTLGKLAKLINGLGLGLEVAGLAEPQQVLQKSDQRLGSTPIETIPVQRHITSVMRPHQTDFGVPDSQLIAGRSKGGIADLTPQRSIKKMKGEPS